MKQFFVQPIARIEHNLAWLSILFFFFGIFLAQQSTAFAYFVNNTLETFIDYYGFVAPIIIYLILTPTLISLFSGEMHGKKFANYTLMWFAKARLWASLYAVIFTSIVFQLPLYSQTASFSEALLSSITSLIWMLTNSVYFYAVYAALISVFVALRVPRLARTLVKGVDLVENLGYFIVPLVPLMMMGIGAYVTILPTILIEELGDGNLASLNTILILGIEFDVSSAYGVILIYVAGALLTAFACSLWHIGLLILTKWHVPSFSLLSYFSEYWLKVYPLLWSTSSEALATPLNLYLIKKFQPNMPDKIRQFVVGTGSFLNINGTIINVFLMTGLVAALLNIEISFVQLLLSIPIVFLIGYGVPGIPGELLIFAGPIVLSMGISPALTPLFLSLYVGLQIGLPDSFRTAANSTDECLCAILLGRNYEEVIEVKPVFSQNISTIQ